MVIEEQNLVLVNMDDQGGQILFFKGGHIEGQIKHVE